MLTLWRLQSVQRLPIARPLQKLLGKSSQQALGFKTETTARLGPRQGAAFPWQSRPLTQSPAVGGLHGTAKRLLQFALSVGTCTFVALYGFPTGLSANLGVASSESITIAGVNTGPGGAASTGTSSPRTDETCTKRIRELMEVVKSSELAAAKEAANEILQYAVQQGTAVELASCGVGGVLAQTLERPDIDVDLRTTLLEILGEIVRNKQTHSQLRDTPLLRSLLHCLNRDAGVAAQCGGMTSGFLFLFGRQRKPVDWSQLNAPLIQQVARILANLALSESIWSTATSADETRLMKTLACALASVHEAQKDTNMLISTQAQIRETERALILCIANVSRLAAFATPKRNFLRELLSALESEDSSVAQYALSGLRSLANQAPMLAALTSEEALERLGRVIARSDEPGLRTMALRILQDAAFAKSPGTTSAIDMRAANRFEKCHIPETLLDVLRENLSGRNDTGPERDAAQMELPQRAACKTIAALCSVPGAPGEHLSRAFLLHGADRELLRIAETFEGIDRFRPPHATVGAAALDAFAVMMQSARIRVQLIARDASFLVRRLADCVPDAEGVTSRVPSPTCRSLLRLIGQLSEDSDTLYLLANQGLCQALYGILQGRLSLSTNEAQILVHTIANLSRIDNAKLDLLGSRGALRILMKLPTLWAQASGNQVQAEVIGNNDSLRRELARALFNVSTGGLSRVMAAQAGGVEAAVRLATDPDPSVRRYGVRALSLFAEQIENSIRIAQANGLPVLASAVAQRRTDPETARAALLALAELTNNVDLHPHLLKLGAGTYFAQYATQSVDIESQQYALAALCNLSATPTGRATLQSLGVHRLLSGLALSAAVPPELAMLANMVVANIVRNEQNVMQTVPFSIPPPE